MDKDQKIVLLIFIIVVGFSISVFYHYVQSFYLGMPYPDSTFLFYPDDKFMDFYNNLKGSADLDPFNPDKINYIGGYPPFGYFVSYLFSLITPWELSWGIFIGLFFIASIFFMKHYLYGLHSKLSLYQILVIFILAFLTYPVLFAVDRSNWDLLICIFLFLFAIAYDQQKLNASAIFLSLSIAIKPLAAILIIPYILRKKLKPALLAIISVGFLSIGSLSLFKGGLLIELQKYMAGSSSAFEKITTFGNISHFSSDLFDFFIVVVNLISKLFGKDISLLGNSVFITGYTIAAGIVFIYFVFFLWKYPQPLWKILAILVILAILLPYTSNDYRLVYLFIPLLMYLSNSTKSRLDMPIIILWGLLFIPKNYLHIGGYDQSISMIINPLLLVGLLVLLTRDNTPAPSVNYNKAKLHKSGLANI